MQICLCTHFKISKNLHMGFLIELISLSCKCCQQCSEDECETLQLLQQQ